MTTENNAQGAADNVGTQAAQQDSSSTADKLYGNSAAGGDKQTNASGDSQSQQQGTDEANKSSDAATDKKGDQQKDGEESKQTDVKIYDEVALPTNLPEGFQVDQGLFDSVKEVAAKHNVPKEAVQELVDLYAKRTGDQYSNAVEAWGEALKADKEVGGDNLAQTGEYCQKVFKQFGNDEAKQMLEISGLGNHPGLVKMFAKIGKSMSEGGAFIKGNNNTQRSAADVLYDKS